MADSYRIAVLASGSGSNLQAILDRVHDAPDPGAGSLTVQVVGVASDKSAAMALERARERGIQTGVFRTADFPDRAQRDQVMLEWIESLRADLVVLAGYMQLLSGEFVQRLEGRLINVHPSLLPSFPGLDAIGQALRGGVQVTGVTVHFVDEGVDTGPIIAQQAVDVPQDRDRDRLEAAIHAVEHELLPQTIADLAAGNVGYRSGGIVEWAFKSLTE